MKATIKIDSNSNDTTSIQLQQAHSSHLQFFQILAYEEFTAVAFQPGSEEVFTLDGTQNKPWSQVSTLIPPEHALAFIEHRVWHSHGSSNLVKICIFTFFSRFPRRKNQMVQVCTLSALFTVFTGIRTVTIRQQGSIVSTYHQPRPYYRLLFARGWTSPLFTSDANISVSSSVYSDFCASSTQSGYPYKNLNRVSPSWDA